MKKFTYMPSPYAVYDAMLRRTVYDVMFQHMTSRYAIYAITIDLYSTTVRTI